MLSDLIDVLSKLLELPDKPERQTTRSDFRVFLLMMASFALVVVLVLNKQWFIGTLPVVIISAVAILLAFLTVFALNKVGVLYHRMPVEVLAIIALFILMYGMAILCGNYHFKFIP